MYLSQLYMGAFVDETLVIFIKAITEEKLNQNLPNFS